MTYLRIQLAVWLSITVVMAGDLVGQSVRTISGAACEGCAVRLEKVVTIGAEGGEGALSSWPRSITRDSKGNIFAVEQNPGSLVAVYDRNGRFIRRIGRQGEGPNEYRFPTDVIVGAADTVYVVDPANARISVLAPETWKASRTVPISVFAENALRGPRGTFVVSADVFRPDQDLSVHHISAEGHVIRSIGGREPSLGARLIYPARAGGLWVARPNALEFDRWNLNGSLVEKTRFDTPRFRTYVADKRTTPREPPQPVLRDFVESRDGMLVALVRVGRADWAANLRKIRTAEGDAWVGDEPNSVTNSWVVVLDPTRGELVAESETATGFAMLLPGSAVAEFALVNDAPVVHVWRLRIEDRRRSQ